MKKNICCTMLSFLALSALAMGQGAPNGGWRRVDDQPQQAPPPRADELPPPQAQNAAAPGELLIRPGTYVTVRINQALSSDRNQPGDAFSGTLVKPVVVDGIVVAQRGQTVGGRVAEAEKAGRVQGVSRLGIELTDLSLVDGQQVPIQSQLVGRSGPTSIGQDAGAIAGTTAAGAAIGAAVNGGVGAGVGAAAGVVAGTIGVLLTRGHSTIIYPESVLTFRIESPVSISTDRAPDAFRYVGPNEYDRPSDRQMQTRAPEPGYGGYGGYAPPPPPPPYYPRYYAPSYYYPYPYYYRPGFSVFIGPRFGYGPGRYYARGYYRGYRR